MIPDDELDPLAAYPDDPHGGTVHHPFSAYCQGHDAGGMGWVRSWANPYPSGSDERRYWRMGHRDASCERLGVSVINAVDEEALDSAWCLAA